MKLSSVTLTALAALAVSSPLLAQGLLLPAGTELRLAAQPTAIAGLASSARHCVSGDAANVHGIGWVAAGTVYTITFESDFTPATAISRLNLQQAGSTGTIGNPDFRATASSSGTMALYVGATGAGGCYRYKVELTPPAASIASESNAALPPAAKPAHTAEPLAITGLASSAKHCISGDYVANVHDIGRVEEGNAITITFASDFDPVAGVTLRNMTTQHGTYIVDDDGGGSLQPLLNFTASHSSTLALYVASFAGRGGCYRYKVEIR